MFYNVPSTAKIYVKDSTQQEFVLARNSAFTVDNVIDLSASSAT